MNKFWFVLLMTAIGFGIGALLFLITIGWAAFWNWIDRQRKG
jgi:hypothetical protein